MGYEVVDLDFETEEIVPGSPTPPKPVGMAFAEPGKKPEYWAFGHPEGNNTTFEKAQRKYRELCEKYQIAAHNINFDYDVAEYHFKVKPKRGIHCSQISSFLENPHAKTLELKEYSEERYGLKPDERDDLRQWIFDNIPGAKKKKSEWGRYISLVPGDIASKYAKGDVLRLRRLRKDTVRYIEKNGMSAAYQRELKLVPILIEMSRRGVPVAVPKLNRDIKYWQKQQTLTERKMCELLGVPEGFNFDQKIPFADAIENAELVDEFLATPGGQRAVSIKALDEVMHSADPEEEIRRRTAFNLFRRRTILDNDINKVMKPWLNFLRFDGSLHVSWNGTRKASDDGDQYGARTGRMSSSPNLQNIPKGLDEETLKVCGALPNMRAYIIPGTGLVALVRDYSQQELRILAHYENDILLRQYQADPRMDLHDLAQRMINNLLNRNFARKPIKNTGFAIIYGAGGQRIGDMTKTDAQTGRLLKRSYLTIFPGLKNLIKDLEAMARDTSNDPLGEPLRTWGGRLYHVEPGRYIKGRWREFHYKLLNVLIQGSAADCTKEAMIRCWEAGVDLRLQVHDELMAISEPGDSAKRMMRNMKDAMESVEFDVEMLSDGKWSTKSFGELIDYPDDIQKAA